MAPVFTIGPQATSLKTHIQNQFNESSRLQKNVRRPDRGQRPTATVDPNTKRRRRRLRRHCSRVRWPRFLHLAIRPHPSRHVSKTTSSYPLPSQKIVRHRDRGQRPTATVDPNTKQRRRRPSRHATVAGYGGPGFHNWPLGHIPQNTYSKPLQRNQSPAKKTFGAATGVSDPRLQKTRAFRHSSSPGYFLQTTDANPWTRLSRFEYLI